MSERQTDLHPPPATSRHVQTALPGIPRLRLGNRVAAGYVQQGFAPATGYVLTRRSLPAGGAGVVEVALTFAFVGMGVRSVPALIEVLVYRLFNFWLPIVPALILLPAIRELRARFQTAEREQTTSTP